MCRQVFIVCWGVRNNGDPYRVIHGVDSWGNTCGRRNKEISGVANSGMDFRTKRSGRSTASICGKKCWGGGGVGEGGGGGRKGAEGGRAIEENRRKVAAGSASLLVSGDVVSFTFHRQKKVGGRFLCCTPPPPPPPPPVCLPTVCAAS